MTFRGTVLKKARFVYSPFSAQAMASIADTVMEAVKARTVRGENVNDATAKALKPAAPGHPIGYPERKRRAGIPAIRNWISPRRYPRSRIKTMRAMKVKSANENKAIIGFIDPVADRIAHINNRREKQFGISPNDRVVLGSAVRAALVTDKVVTVTKG